MSFDDPMPIGAFTQAASVPKETVRYYEQRGLMPAPARTEAGHRRYGPGDVERMRFIKRAQDLGFSLREIGRLLSLRDAGDADAASVKALAEKKLTELDEKLRTIAHQRTELERLAAACDGRGPADACPILQGLQKRALRDDANSASD